MNIHSFKAAKLYLFFQLERKKLIFFIKISSNNSRIFIYFVITYLKLMFDEKTGFNIYSFKYK